MNSSSEKYGESTRVRRNNGAKLKKIRVSLGLTAKDAALKLGLKNTHSIVNAEMACSSEMLEQRMGLYKKFQSGNSELPPVSTHTSQAEAKAEPKNISVKKEVASDVDLNSGTATHSGVNGRFDQSTKSAESNGRVAHSSTSTRKASSTTNSSDDSKTQLLEVAVKRLASVEKKTETEIWLSLFEGLQA